jgi:hypothetical protein
MRFFRKNTTKPVGGRPVEREIGILFDIDALGSAHRLRPAGHGRPIHGS